jgi:ribosomal protein L12E/L44/L45/RPP1/RPP2
VKIVATKHDKVKPSKRDQRRKELAAGCMLTPTDVLWVSSAKHVNIEELRARINEWLAPVQDWAPPAPPTRKERAAARAAEAEAGAPAGIDPDTGEYDDEDEWN